jgi:hypothetical protein
MMAHVTLAPHLPQDLLVTQTKRMLLNRGTLVFTAVFILGIAAWKGIQVTGGRLHPRRRRNASRTVEHRR